MVHTGVWWVMKGGVGQAEVGRVMQGWVGHAGLGWCRDGVGM